MLKNLDRTLAMLLSLGAIGHTFGSIMALRGHPAQLLWALCASVLIVLISAINLLRTWRPGDRLLAWLAAMGALCWLVVSVAFGVIVNNITDLRVVVFVILSVGLIIFSVKDALAKGKA